MHVTFEKEQPMHVQKDVLLFLFCFKIVVEDLKKQFRYESICAISISVKIFFFVIGEIWNSWNIQWDIRDFAYLGTLIIYVENKKKLVK